MPSRTQTLRDRLAVTAGRCIASLLRRMLHRGASALPGRVADRISPSLLARAISAPPLGLIVVSGSSGKSTTTKMLAAILVAHGLSVFTNSSTANLRQGVLSAVIFAADAVGCLSHDVAVVELDEATASALAPVLRPVVTVLTNVSDEQLDRFHSADRVVEMLSAIAARSQAIVLCADDTALRKIPELNRGGDVSWFGETASSGTQLVKLTDRSAQLVVDGTPLSVQLPARGVHYALDATAAIEGARRVLGDRFRPATVASALMDLEPVFGRGEIATIDGHRVELVLVQNPDSMKRNLALLDPPSSRLLVAVGSDVRDASWLWQVDTRGLGHVDVVSGSRAYDAATRLAYDGVSVGRVVPNLADAVSLLLALPEGVGPTTIVFTADAMRRVRRRHRLDRSVA